MDKQHQRMSDTTPDKRDWRTHGLPKPKYEFVISGKWCYTWELGGGAVTRVYENMPADVALIESYRNGRGGLSTGYGQFIVTRETWLDCGGGCGGFGQCDDPTLITNDLTEVVRRVKLNRMRLVG